MLRRPPPPWADRALIAGITALLLALTIAPTIHTLVDSAEYAIGAKTLGIVHAPGYPLYLLIAHLFTYLPFGDVAFRVNLFSAAALVLTSVFTHGLLLTLLRGRLVALGASLSLVMSFYGWQLGVAAEVYGPQVMLLALTGWLLALMWRYPARRGRLAWLTGLAYGLAVAMNPSSALFAGGVALVFVLLRVPLRLCLLSGALAVGVFCVSLLYFPLRYAAGPAFNVAGIYDAAGAFVPVDLQTPAGVFWLVSGAPFRDFMFPDGYLLPPESIGITLALLWNNFLVIGVLAGVAGLVVMALRSRGLLAVWLACYLPYTYYFSGYSVADRDTMMSPSYLVWTVALAYGLHWLTDGLAVRWRALVVLVLPALMLWVNYPLVNASDLYSVRDDAQSVMDSLPPEAVVFGRWRDVIALEYLYHIDGQRPDVSLYNLFYFAPDAFPAYLDALYRDDERPVVLLLSSFERDDPVWALLAQYPSETVTLRPDADTPLYYVQLRR